MDVFNLACFGGGWLVGKPTPRHRPDGSGSSTRSLRRSDLAGFWDGIGHTATRGIATSLSLLAMTMLLGAVAPLILRQAQHERRAGFGGGFSSALLRASARSLRATSLPLFFGSFPGFGPLSHPTKVRQPAPSHIWERAGGEGRQRRRLGSVATFFARYTRRKLVCETLFS